METTGIIGRGYIRIIRYILGLHRETDKENGNYCNGLYRD